MKNNFLWKYIDVPQKDLENIRTLYLECLPDNTHFFQQLDLNIKNFLGLEIQRCVLIQVEANAIGRIHTDFRPKEYGDQLALNIPLLNCENSITELWLSNYDPPIKYTKNGQPYRYFDENQCTKISEFKLISPVLFRTDVPHSVSNYSKNIRKAISIRFKDDPWHLV